MSSLANAIIPRVHILEKSVARRIAAGEVISRPYAVVRELLDNAIDAKADDIKIHLRRGGVDEIRVTDNGQGMNREDLSLCWLPHATSKIATLDDLDTSTTLGFRGEALASLTTCSRVEIISTFDGATHKLSVHGGKLIDMESATGPAGTTVSVRDLFFNMPARRQFLRSVVSESRFCRQVFLEKAAAHPELCFRLFVDGLLKIYLQKSTIADRVNSCWPGLVPLGSWWTSMENSENFDITVVHARPEVSRRDRQQIKVFVNRRRIDEFSLVQSVVHAYDAVMPGGVFPLAQVFIEIDPGLVDFNIHPAKKEARFKDLPLVRHRLVEVIQNRLSTESYERRLTPPPSIGKPDSLFSNDYQSVADRQSLSSMGLVAHESASFHVSAEKNPRTSNRQRFNPIPPKKDSKFRYLGQLLGVFLLAEVDESLFIVDQHAAHERVLFERLRESKPISEYLLIPRPLHLDKTALMRLELRREGLEQLGLILNCRENGEWELLGLPQSAASLEDELVDFIERGAGKPEDFQKEFWADIACKAAVKSNCVLDNAAAEQLLRDAFALDSPRCPHGRPLWFEISRQELFDVLGRTG